MSDQTSDLSPASLRRQVDDGNVDAMLRLASALLKGEEGFAKDAPAAAEMYRQAAERGNADAMFLLGKLLHYGADGVERNPPEAAPLYRQAVERGHADAMIQLGRLLLQDWVTGVNQNPPEAEVLFRQAVERGHAEAMYYLGLLLHRGADGINQNLPEAASLYRQAAERGHAESMANLGMLLQIGASGVEWNASEAVVLLRRAAALGKGTAVKKFSEYMSRGLCSREDIDEALNKFERFWKCIDTTNSVSAEDVTNVARALLSEDIGDMRDPARAKSFLEDLLREEPAHGPALHELAVLYENGDEGVPKDEEKAQNLFSQATSPSVDIAKYYGPCGRAIITAGPNYTAVVERIMRAGTTKPRTCLLVTLGGGARGKTATVNSLRGMPFVASHVPTEMAALNKCVVGPGGYRRQENEIAEIAHRRSSLRVNASQFFNIPLPTSGVLSQSISLSDEMREGFQRSGRIKHRDVMERVRRGIIHDFFPGDFGGNLLEIWDMAGQSEYEMAHSMVIGRASVLVFVTDLERVENERTRMDEVRVLCHWMQLAYLLVRRAEKTRALIVGTRKGSCSSVTKTLRILKNCLAKQLDNKVYNTWVKVRQTGGSFDEIPRIIAIENSESQKDIESSGLGELEQAVNAAAAEVVASRESVPLRWLALLDKLEQEHRCGSRVCFTAEEVYSVAEHFPGYVSDDARRERDVLEGLRCLAWMGRLVLWELKKEEWYAFMDVGKIVHLLGRTTAPEEKLQDQLDASDMYSLQTGRISQSGLFQLWEGYEKDEKQVLLKLLCNFDLLMILEGDEECVLRGDATIGIPARMPYGWEGLKWGWKKGEKELEVVTTFDIGIPQGLIGGIMACMHRTVSERRGRKGRGRHDPFHVAIYGLIGAAMAYMCKTLLEQRRIEVSGGWNLLNAVIPPLLIGGLMMCMHKMLSGRRGSMERESRVSGSKVRGGVNTFAEVRANAALLKENDGSRVFIGFEAPERRLLWKFRGFEPRKLVRLYLMQLEKYLRNPIRDVQVGFRHAVLLECENTHCEGDGESRKTVEVEVTRGWVRGEEREEEGTEMTPFCKACHTPCSKPWREAESEVRGADEAAVKTSGSQAEEKEQHGVMRNRKYEVFISHAGTEKLSLAVPLYRHLSQQNVDAFLDIEKLRIDSRTAPEVMLRAMDEAKIGIFVLSPEFAGREWPLKELRRFLDRSKKDREEDRPVLLPVFYGLSVSECRRARENIYREDSAHIDVLRRERFFEPERLSKCSVEMAAEALEEVSAFSGVEATRVCCGSRLSSAAVVEDTVRRICDLMRGKGYLHDLYLAV